VGMNTDNEASLFRPLPTNVTKRENPANRLLGLSTPTKFEVIARSTSYLTQFAEAGGLHSCLPTALLNGLIHLGVITHDEAQDFQDSFKVPIATCFLRENLAIGL